MQARTNPEPIPEEENQGDALRRQAECCRRLAKATYDRRTSQALNQMADGFDKSAEELQRDGKSRSEQL